MDGQDSARAGTAERKDGIGREASSVDREVPREIVRARKRAPRAVPVKRACANGPPERG